MKNNTNSKQQNIQIALLYGISFAFGLFVYYMYKDVNENGVVTLSSINKALIKSSIFIVVSVIVGSLLYSRKHSRKEGIEDDKTEISKNQKIGSIIISIVALLGLFCIVLLCIFNYWRAANIVFWFGGGACFIAIVIFLIFQKKKSKEVSN